MFSDAEGTWRTPVEAAAYIVARGGSTTVKTLASWRCLGRGPRFRKVGWHVYYGQTELDLSIEASTTPVVGSTAELRNGARPQ
jgi:hypothetical protein